VVNAKSIAYPRVGSGAYLDGLFKRLGISDAIKSRVTRPDSDIVSELVAKGDLRAFLEWPSASAVMKSQGMEPR
jgi:hypothetical protein